MFAAHPAEPTHGKPNSVFGLLPSVTDHLQALAVSSRRERPAMTRCLPSCVLLLALLARATPACAAELASDQPVLPGSSAQSNPTNDCEAAIEKLDASDAEGEERLRQKRAVIDLCSGQYRHDGTIEMLVNECAKYEEQPVIKQQFVAECQLAAFTYANALRALKEGYRQ
jgi:hypothetical protein